MAEQLAYGLKEAASLIGVSHWTLRKMAKDGRLPVVRIGRRVLVEHESLRQIIEAGRTLDNQ